MPSPRLPDFVVVGAYKAGTTTLDHLLRAHPQVFVPARKEPNHWAFADGANADHPAAAYCVGSRADYRALFAGAGDDQRVGEVSPAYLALPGTAERVHEAAPDARIVAVLRDPVERAYSDYLMYVRDGREDAPDFRTALDRQEERRAAGLPTGYYVETGFYGRQLAPWVELFGRDRVHVLLLEDLSRDPRATFAALCDHLGVHEVLPDVGSNALNVSGVPRGPAAALAHRLRHRYASEFYRLPRRLRERVDAALTARLERPPIKDAVRQRLVGVYRDDVAALERLLGAALTGWKSFDDH